MSKLISSLQRFFREPSTREFLLWMLPALVLGLVLRVVITVALPYGVFHDDTADFLTTPDRLLNDFRFELHSKKTFLVPILYTVPFLLRIPALIAIPLVQHVLGMAMILLIGLLIRLWFRGWKVVILPLTLLAAANPFILWYEHTLIAESIFLFTTVLLAVAGTLYALERSKARFWFLLVALFLEAGARPEGKLLFGFGIAFIVLTHWRDRQASWRRIAWVVALAIVAQIVTPTSQAGLLLYTSVARLTPRELRSAPGFEPYIGPVRAELQKRWDERRSFPKVRDRRAVAEAVERYIKESPEMKKSKIRRGVNQLCKKIAAETCMKNFGYLPVHIFHKFRTVSVEAPSGLLDNDWLFVQQREAFLGPPRALKMAPGLTGQPITTPEEINRFVDTHYGEVPWFDQLADRWLKIVNYFRFADTRLPNPEYPAVPVYDPGLPFYFVAGALGIAVVAFRCDRLQFFHIAWSLTLFGFFYTIMLTANVRPRFRLAFEPFWFIYIALLGECLLLGVLRLFRRGK